MFSVVNEYILEYSVKYFISSLQIDNNTVVLTAVLIPKKVYDINYNKSMNDSRKI